MKTYKKAPLPFTGQKRNFLKHFIPVLQQNIPNDGAGWTIVDVFGDSSLLAHTTKRILPQARVIYNDFDGYAKRLQHIADTERLRQRCIAIIGTHCININILRLFCHLRNDKLNAKG